MPCPNISNLRASFSDSDISVRNTGGSAATQFAPSAPGAGRSSASDGFVVVVCAVVVVAAVVVATVVVLAAVVVVAAVEVVMVVAAVVATAVAVVAAVVVLVVVAAVVDAVVVVTAASSVGSLVCVVCWTVTVVSTDDTVVAADEVVDTVSSSDVDVDSVITVVVEFADAAVVGNGVSVGVPLQAVNANIVITQNNAVDLRIMILLLKNTALHYAVLYFFSTKY